MKVERFKRGFKPRVMKIEHLKLQFGGAGHREAKIHLAKWVFKHRVMKVEHVKLQFGGSVHRFIGRVARDRATDRVREEGGRVREGGGKVREGGGRVREGGRKQLNADCCWIVSVFLLAYRQRYTRSRSDSWSSNHFSAQSSISRSSPSSGPPDSPNRTTGSSAGNRLHHGGGSST